MTKSYHIDPRRTKNRMRPLKAWGHMQNLLDDHEDTEQVFHILEALNGNALQKELIRFSKTDKGQARLKERRYLPNILDDHDSLKNLPAGSVGRAYVTFMEREGLTAAGLVAESEKWWDQHERFDDDLEYFSHRMRDVHDLFHVLTGYGRDQLGETSLLAFTYSQEKGLGALFISWLGARQLAKLAPRQAKVMRAIGEGKRHGKIAAKIVEEDIVALLKEPLKAARKRLGIQEPAAYKHALSVLHAEGYEGQLSAA